MAKVLHTYLMLFIVRQTWKIKTKSLLTFSGFQHSLLLSCLFSCRGGSLQLEMSLIIGEHFTGSLLNLPHLHCQIDEANRCKEGREGEGVLFEFCRCCAQLTKSSTIDIKWRPGLWNTNSGDLGCKIQTVETLALKYVQWRPDLWHTFSGDFCAQAVCSTHVEKMQKWMIDQL